MYIHAMKKGSNKKPRSGKRTVLLTLWLTPEEDALTLKTLGPKGQRSANVRTLITDPFARKNPNEWRQFLRLYGRIKRILIKALESVQCEHPADLCGKISAIIEARKLLEEFRRHAP